MEDLQVEIQHFVDWWKLKVKLGHLTRTQFEEMLRKAMHFIGMQYKLDGWKITLIPESRAMAA